MRSPLCTCGLLTPIPTLEQRVRQFLASCENWWDVGESYVSGAQSLPNLGTVGSATDLRFGSSTGVDSGDPTGLAYQGVPYFQLPGAAGNYLTVPDSAPLDITGDFQLFADIASPQWWPASARMDIASRGSADPDRAWFWGIDSTGAIRFSWYPTGSAASALTAQTAGSAMTLANGSRGQLLMDLDVDNGAGGWTVRFWIRPDGGSWTAITPITGAGVTSLPAITAPVTINGTVGGQQLVGNVYGFSMRTGTGSTTPGAAVLDVSAAGVSSSASSFTCATGQIATIVRAASGHKTAVVNTSMLRLGADDYLEAADHASLNAGAGDFTVILAGRHWATPGSYARWIEKKNGGGAALGWSLSSDSTALRAGTFIGDATNAGADAGTTFTSGTPQVSALVVNRTTNRLQTGSSGVLSTGVSIATVGTLTNALVMRVGAASGGGAFGDFEFRAALVHRGLLTAQQLADITAYYQGVTA